MATVGWASLQIIPSMQGVGAEVSRGLSGMRAAGQQAGQDIGQGVADGLKRAESVVAKASNGVARTREAEVKAAAKVRIEEAKLQELRDKGITDGSRYMAAEERLRVARDRGIQATRDARAASEDLTDAQRRLANAQRDNADASEESESSTEDNTEAQERNADGAVDLAKKLGGLAIAAAGIGSAMDLASQSLEKSKIGSKLAASFGETPEEAKRYGEVAGNLYADGIGESMDQVAESVSAVGSTFGSLDSMGGARLEDLTAKASNFANVFDQDVSTSVQTAGMLMENGLASNADEAFDMMTRGMQEVSVSMRDELPEILQEYGTNFRALGYDGKDAFNLLIAASEQGKFALDKTGDALKEFTIRGADMSTGSVAAFEAVGLNAEEMSAAIASGGPAAQDALQKTAKGILGIEDPAARANAAIALFGTPLEDLSVDQIPAFLQSLSGTDDAMGDVTGATDQMAATLNDNAGSALDNMKRAIQGGLLDALEGMADWVGKNSDLLKTIGLVVAPLAVGLLTYKTYVVAATLATKAWAAIQAILNGTMMLNPVGLIVAAIAALVAAIVIIATKTTWFQDIWAVMWDAIKTATSAVWDNFLKPVFDAIMVAIDFVIDHWKIFAGVLAVIMGPVGIVIAAIGLIIMNFDKVKTVLSAVWAVVQPILSGMFEAIKILGAIVATVIIGSVLIAWNLLKAGIELAWVVIQPIFDAFVSVLTGLGNAAMWLWNNAIVPAFDGIKSVISLWWTGVQIYWDLLKMAWNGISTAAMWLWHGVIEPVFNGIGAAISFVWNSIIMPVFGAISAAFNALGALFGWVWTAIIKPNWDALGFGISFVWNSIISPTWEALKTALGAVGDFFNWIWNSIIKPAWDALGSGISWVVDSILKPAFNGITTALQNVGDFFGTIVSGIQTAWDKLKGYVATPINFVIETIWNNGLLKAWNKVADFLPGLKTMAPLEKVAFADGGPVPMGKDAVRGKDSVNALLMPDEHVWDVEDVDKAGGHGAMYRMRNMVDAGKPFTWTPAGVADATGDGAALARFADGGAVAPGGRLSPIAGEDRLQDIAKLMGRIIKQLWPKGVSAIGGYRPPDGYNEHSSGRALDVMINDAQTGTQIKDWSMANSPKYPVDWTIWQQKMWYPDGRSEGMPDRGDPTQNHMDHDHIFYKPQAVDPNVMPDNLVGFDGMTSEDKMNVLKKKVKEIVDKALDPIKDGIAGAVGSPPPEWLGVPPKVLDTTKDKAVDALFDFAGKLGEKLGEAYDKAKDIATTIGNVVKNPIGAVSGLFRDQGGYIPPGQSVVTNETGKPEAVFNWRQLELLKQILEGIPMKAGSTFSPVDRAGTALSSLGDIGKNALTEIFDVGEWISLADRYTIKPAAESAAAAPAATGTTPGATAGTTPGTTTTPEGATAPAPGTAGYVPPTYGDGTTIEQTEVPLTTQMPEFAPEGDGKYPFEIARSAKEKGMDKLAAIIGNMTALVEVGDPMKMYANNADPETLQFPHDAISSDGSSSGLFQQQNNGAWGTAADRMDPFKSAGMFFDVLKGFDYHSMAPGDAAQQVQRSAFPGKYAEKQGRADQLVNDTKLFDTGGWLMPNAASFNATNDPEPILTGSQWDTADAAINTVKDLVGAGARSGGGDTYVTNATFRDERSYYEEKRREARLGMKRYSGGRRVR